MAAKSWLAVCEPEVATALNGADCCAGPAAAGGSPIDNYYEYVEHLLTLGSRDALRDSATLGRLLVLGLVSGVESYFRVTLAELLRICPVARTHAADQVISFGAIDYYGIEAVEWGLFDAASLAGASEIASRARKLLGIDIPQGSSVAAALEEFDKVCHLRHAAVHSRGTLGRGNAVALGLERDAGRQVLHVSVPVLHQAGAACHSAVRACNRFLYRSTVERWIGGGTLVGVWKEDKPRFEALFGLFISRRDGIAPANAYLAYRDVPGLKD